MFTDDPRWGVISIVAGIAFIAGVAFWHSYAQREGGVVWVGGYAVGALLILRGLRTLWGRFGLTRGPRKCAMPECDERSENTVEWYESNRAHTRDFCGPHAELMVKSLRSARALPLGAGRLLD